MAGDESISRYEFQGLLQDGSVDHEGVADEAFVVGAGWCGDEVAAVSDVGFS